MEKKAKAIQYLKEINSPEAIERIYRFIYRQFLKDPIPAEKEPVK